MKKPIGILAFLALSACGSCAGENTASYEISKVELLDTPAPDAIKALGKSDPLSAHLGKAVNEAPPESSTSPSCGVKPYNVIIDSATGEKVIAAIREQNIPKSRYLLDGNDQCVSSITHVPYGDADDLKYAKIGDLIVIKTTAITGTGEVGRQTKVSIETNKRVKDEVPAVPDIFSRTLSTEVMLSRGQILVMDTGDNSLTTSKANPSFWSFLPWNDSTIKERHTIRTVFFVRKVN